MESTDLKLKVFNDPRIENLDGITLDASLGQYGDDWTARIPPQAGTAASYWNSGYTFSFGSGSKDHVVSWAQTYINFTMKLNWNATAEPFTNAFYKSYMLNPFGPIAGAIREARLVINGKEQETVLDVPAIVGAKLRFVPKNVLRANLSDVVLGDSLGDTPGGEPVIVTCEGHTGAIPTTLRELDRYTLSSLTAGTMVIGDADNTDQDAITFVPPSYSQQYLWNSKFPFPTEGEEPVTFRIPLTLLFSWFGAGSEIFTSAKDHIMIYLKPALRSDMLMCANAPDATEPYPLVTIDMHDAFLSVCYKRMTAAGVRLYIQPATKTRTVTQWAARSYPMGTASQLNVTHNFRAGLKGVIVTFRALNDTARLGCPRWWNIMPFSTLNNAYITIANESHKSSYAPMVVGFQAVATAGSGGIPAGVNLQYEDYASLGHPSIEGAMGWFHDFCTFPSDSAYAGIPGAPSTWVSRGDFVKNSFMLVWSFSPDLQANTDTRMDVGNIVVNFNAATKAEFGYGNSDSVPQTTREVNTEAVIIELWTQIVEYDIGSGTYIPINGTM